MPKHEYHFNGFRLGILAEDSEAIEIRKALGIVLHALMENQKNTIRNLEGNPQREVVRKAITLVTEAYEDTAHISILEEAV